MSRPLPSRKTHSLTCLRLHLIACPGGLFLNCHTRHILDLATPFLLDLSNRQAGSSVFFRERLQDLLSGMLVFPTLSLAFTVFGRTYKFQVRFCLPFSKQA